MPELRLDLSRHCIETEIRRQYNRALSSYFRANAQDKVAIEARLTMIRLALEGFDFGALRSLHPRLAGGTDVPVILTLKDGVPALLMDGEGMPPILKPFN